MFSFKAVLPVLLITGLTITGVTQAFRSSVFVYAESTAPLPLPNSPEGCEVFQGSFLDNSAADMLKRLDVMVYQEDRIEAFPDPALGIGARVTLCRAPVITIIDGKKVVTLRSWALSVAELAEEQRLLLADQDKVEPAREVGLKGGDTVRITRVKESQVTVKVPLSFKTVTTKDANLEKGKKEVKKKGVPGMRHDLHKIVYENNVKVSDQVIKTEVIKEPENEEVVEGTKIVQLDDIGKASWYAGVAPMTAAHKTLPKGTMIDVVNVQTGARVTVRVADRGPFVAGRTVDLSKDAFAKIASLGSGVVTVRIEKSY